MGRLREDFKEIVEEQVEFRELFYQIVARDLRLRYKQTVMGFGWALLTPVLNTVMFSIVFMRVAPVETAVPYPLFAYCGLLAWTFTASSLRFAITSLTSNTNLVTKVYFPRELFPFAAVAVSWVDFLVAASVLVAMMVYYGVSPASSVLFLPALLAIHIAFTAAIALLLAMANLFYRDVKYLFEVILMFWMFGSAIVYPLEAVGGTLGIIIRANPMTAIVEAYRSILLYGTVPDAALFLPAALGSAVALPLAWLVFHRSEFRFAESI
jgi:ABC-type polysaccharide/polyol phosphate export permease